MIYFPSSVGWSYCFFFNLTFTYFQMLNTLLPRNKYNLAMIYISMYLYISTELPWWLRGKKSTCSVGAAGDASSIPGSGRSPGGRHGNHSTILAWRIPWTEKPSGLWSIGLQRVRHDWSDLACMHTCINILKILDLVSVLLYSVYILLIAFWSFIMYAYQIPKWINTFILFLNNTGTFRTL